MQDGLTIRITTGLTPSHPKGRSESGGIDGGDLTGGMSWYDEEEQAGIVLTNRRKAKEEAASASFI
jgi:hypothetical protein